MVDKKLSEFSAVQASDVSDLVVLYLDENLSPKNGRLSFNSFVSMLALLSGNNTFTGDNTFSGDVVFEETATFNKGINGTAARATADASGNNIENTYATKTELDQKSSFKLFHHDWFDYQLNDMAWLRADTFSWQDGTVYTNAYNHLVDEYYNAGIESGASDTIGGTTVWYRVCADGHKVCPPDQESNVLAIYNATGVAWYYIIDPYNQRFKLPRENPAREVLGQSAPVIGISGQPLGLQGANPLTGEGVLTGPDNQNAPFLLSGSDRLYNRTIGISSDSTKSGMIADLSETTGVYKGKQYLYFYVGQFSQSATEQTAGLNSELFNGKADVEALNNKIQLVSTAPASQTNGILYVIPE